MKKLFNKLSLYFKMQKYDECINFCRFGRVNELKNIINECGDDFLLYNDAKAFTECFKYKQEEMLSFLMELPVFQNNLFFIFFNMAPVFKEDVTLKNSKILDKLIDKLPNFFIERHFAFFIENSKILSFNTIMKKIPLSFMEEKITYKNKRKYVADLLLSNDILFDNYYTHEDFKNYLNKNKDIIPNILYLKFKLNKKTQNESTDFVDFIKKYKIKYNKNMLDKIKKIQTYSFLSNSHINIDLYGLEPDWIKITNEIEKEEFCEILHKKISDEIGCKCSVSEIKKSKI